MPVAIVYKTKRIILILLFMLILAYGCGHLNSPISKTFRIQSLEEITSKYYKELRNVKELTLETEISSRVFIAQQTPVAKLEYLKATLNILPLSDNRQTVVKQVIIPSGKTIGDSIEFNIDDPSPGRHDFKLKSTTKLMHEFVRVEKREAFPLETIPEALINYTKPGMTIDSDNDEIRTLASSMAKGEDDLYRVVYKASKWVRENVEDHFDISTLSITQKASWVLENRKGVCDEQTNLFIGLLRSLEIPTKFVTGLVSMNFNGAIKFKYHAWAEVYFPSTGWVPFDIAYNQLGFIDATHLKLSESIDTLDSRANYQWAGHARVVFQNVDIQAKIGEETGIITPPLEIVPKAWYGKIGMGSYNVIEATIINPHQFYVVTDISLHTPIELKTMGKNPKMILMEPKSRKTVYWIVKPTLTMQESVVATFPLEIVSSRGASSGTKFSVSRGEKYPKHRFKRLKNAVIKKMRHEP